jgi:hypothetical protein
MGSAIFAFGNTTADALNGTGRALIRKCKKKSVGENPTLL